MFGERGTVVYVKQVMVSVTRSLGNASVKHSGCRTSSLSTLAVVTLTAVSVLSHSRLLGYFDDVWG